MRLEKRDAILGMCLQIPVKKKCLSHVRRPRFGDLMINPLFSGSLLSILSVSASEKEKIVCQGLIVNLLRNGRNVFRFTVNAPTL
jgi:hypothetical protein